MQEEEFPKRIRNPKDKKKRARIEEEDYDKKRIAKEYKKHKKQVLEDEDDWNYWQEYYK